MNLAKLTCPSCKTEAMSLRQKILSFQLPACKNCNVKLRISLVYVFPLLVAAMFFLRVVDPEGVLESVAVVLILGAVVGVVSIPIPLAARGGTIES